MYEVLRQLCENGNEGRGDVILDKIREIGIDSEIQCFDHEGIEYRNIISRVRNGSPNHKIAFSAHYDKVGVGEGALDNGAAVAELIGFLEEIIKDPKDIDLRLIFFDEEENACKGSNYFAANNKTVFEGIYNLDITGLGDSIMISKSSYDIWKECYVPNNEMLNKRIQRLCEKESMPYYFIDSPGSDNVVCNKNGIPSTIITTLPEKFGKKWEEEGKIPEGLMVITFQSIHLWIL